MKTLLIIAALAVTAAPAMASSVTARLTGCETKDMGGYLNFVDPQCALDAGVTSRPGDDPARPAKEEEEPECPTEKQA